MTDKKPCEVDDKTVFDNQTEYTEFCKVCQHHVKIYKYRACEYQHEQLAKVGQDPFDKVKEIERVSNFQQGIGTRPAQNSTEKSLPKKPTRRGR